MASFSQPVLLAVSQVKDFERFLQGPMEVCILMDLHIRLMPGMVRAAHAAGKKVFFHADLIRGLADDEYGCEYICQQLGADGVISTKAKVLRTARRAGRTAILRLFLIDSKSLDKGIDLILSLRPDYVELLPGLASGIIPEIRSRLAEGGAADIPLLCGGLIRTGEQVERCLADGACAVTLSNRAMAEEYLASHPVPAGRPE